MMQPVRSSVPRYPMAGTERGRLPGTMRSRFAVLLILLGVAPMPGFALGEDHGFVAGVAAEGPDTTSATATGPGAAYAFPSGRDQFQAWAWNALGPAAIGGNLVGASWRQWVTDEPPEWGSGKEGFAKRFGAGCLTTAIGETSLSLASAAMRQDPGYYRSPRSGFGPRLWHAVAMTFMARTPNGDAVFSPAKTLSPFAGPIVTQTAVYPDRYDYTAALTSGAYGLLITAGWNTLREFFVRTPAWGGGRSPGLPAGGRKPA